MFDMCGEGGGFMPARWNATWWGYWVVCITVEDVDEKGEETDFERYFKYKDDDDNQWVKTTLLRLASPPDRVVSGQLNKLVTGFTEFRQDWSHLPRGWLTYHSFNFIHISGGELTICLEKKTDKLEIMLAKGPRSTNFMQDFSALIRPRNPDRCSAMSHRAAGPGITVARLFEWIDGPLARSWQPYSLMGANCQHFAEELHEFLLNPMRAEDDHKIQELPDVLHTISLQVSANPKVLMHLPPHLSKERSVALTAVTTNGRALEYVGEQFQQDWRVVFLAVQQDGDALEFATEELKKDREVVLAAVQNKGSALKFAHPSLHRDSQLLLAAGWHAPSVFVSTWSSEADASPKSTSRGAEASLENRVSKSPLSAQAFSADY